MFYSPVGAQLPSHWFSYHTEIRLLGNHPRRDCSLRGLNNEFSGNRSRGIQLVVVGEALVGSAQPWNGHGLVARGLITLRLISFG